MACERNTCSRDDREAGQFEIGSWEPAVDVKLLKEGVAQRGYWDPKMVRKTGRQNFKRNALSGRYP